MIVPAQRYAAFAHTGHISTIRGTMQAIFGSGLADAGLATHGPFSVIEYYGPDFDPQAGRGTVEIWIGLGD